jgi:hypothetical protein
MLQVYCELERELEFDLERELEDLLPELELTRDPLDLLPRAPLPQSVTLILGTGLM